MKRLRLFGCVLGLSGLLLPARLAFGDGGAAGPMGDPTATDPYLPGVWSVSVEPDHATAQAGKNAFSDLLLFEDSGQFTAEAFGPMGYGQSPYVVSELSDGSKVFTITMSNAGGGTLVWNGVRQGSTLIGSLVWTRSDGSVGTYSFRAQRLDD